VVETAALTSSSAKPSVDLEMVRAVGLEPTLLSELDFESHTLETTY